MSKIDREVTPVRLRCSVGGCPAVFISTDKEVVVIGKKLSPDLEAELADRIADDEFAVKLSIEFFEALNS
jgi:hypothetical protein